MQDRSDDLATITRVVDVGSEGSGAEDLLHQGLIAGELADGPQQAGKAKGFDPRRLEFEAVSGPDMFLSPRTRLGERVEAYLRRIVHDEAGNHLAICDMRARANR